jgi:hypothetical protein
MKILCIGQIENEEFIHGEVAKQSIQPDDVAFYVDENPAIGIKARRERIARNHNILWDMVETYKPDLVWQIEGDSVLPRNALERLVGHYIADPGKVYSGVQVGRHGLYCLGAWHLNDERTVLASANYQDHGLKEVNAMGMYCFLTSVDIWLSGKCEWADEHWGPDVNYFLSIDAPKVADMDLHIGHRTKSGIIQVSDISTCNATFFKELGKWRMIQE